MFMCINSTTSLKEAREFILGQQAARLGADCPEYASNAFFVAYHFSREKFNFLKLGNGDNK